MYKTLKVEDAANLAIFHEQLTTPRAVRFVISRAKVDRKKALLAIETALTGYKNKA